MSWIHMRGGREIISKFTCCQILQSDWSDLFIRLQKNEPRSKTMSAANLSCKIAQYVSTASLRIGEKIDLYLIILYYMKVLS